MLGLGGIVAVGSGAALDITGSQPLGQMSVAPGGSLSIAGGNQTVDVLSGNGALGLTGGATLTVGSSGGSSVFAGAIGGNGSLTERRRIVFQTLTGGQYLHRWHDRPRRDALRRHQQPARQHRRQRVAALYAGPATARSYDGAISGSGALLKAGNSALTLTAHNTYSGGTLITAGTLIGTTNTLQGGIINNAALVLRQDTDGTFAGAIGGHRHARQIRPRHRHDQRQHPDDRLDDGR